MRAPVSLQQLWISRPSLLASFSQRLGKGIVDVVKPPPPLNPSL